MFHQQIAQWFTLRQIVPQYASKIAKIINQEIVIQDLYIYPHMPVDFLSFTTHSAQPAAHTTGEFNFELIRYKNTPVLLRLIDHIKQLAFIANQYHQHTYCKETKPNQFEIKPDCLNKITCLLLSEFSLYTKIPLTTDHFEALIRAIEDIAKTHLSNVHLLLSSFARLNENGEIINTVLYVECGINAKIHVFCKASQANEDPAYPNRTTFKQRFFRSRERSYACIGSRKNVVSSDSVFIIETLGGAKFFQCIDVCLDHDLQHAKKLLETYIKKASFFEFMPRQINHVVTSNFTNIDSLAKTTHHVTHINPTQTHDRQVNRAHDTLSISAFPSDFAHATKIAKIPSSKGFIVHAPPFGAPYQVVMTEERALTPKTDSILLHERKSHEQKQMKETWKFMEQFPDAESFYYFFNQAISLDDFELIQAIFFFACKTGNRDLMYNMLHSDYDLLNFKFQDRWNALILCVKHEQNECVKMLLNMKEIDLYDTNQHRKFAWEVAFQTKNLTIITLFLEYALAYRIKKIIADTFHYACRENEHELVRRVLASRSRDASYNTSYTAFYTLAKEECLRITTKKRYKFEFDEDIFLYFLLPHIIMMCDDPLLDAVIAYNPDLLNPHRIAKQSPLYLAAEFERVDMVYKILKHSPYPLKGRLAYSNPSHSPFFAALKSVSSKKTMFALLDALWVDDFLSPSRYLASLDAINSAISKYKGKNILTWFLEHRPVVFDKQDRNSTTIFHHLVYKNRFDLISFLIRRHPQHNIAERIQVIANDIRDDQERQSVLQKIRENSISFKM